MKTEPMSGDIVTELQKLAEYHAKQVILWKELLEQSTDKANPYAKRMIAMHEEFGGVLFLISQKISTSINLEGTAT